MKKDPAEITKRLVAAILATATVVGVSALAMHTPTHNRDSLARPLKSIQTDKATLFYADSAPTGAGGLYYVEKVLPTTRESLASTENLKLVAKAF
jgi:hypothetical protein